MLDVLQPSPSAPLATNDPLLPTTVPSDEQLEMALDDLPMLDSDEELPFDNLVDDPVASGVAVPASAHPPVESNALATHAQTSAVASTAAAAIEPSTDSVEHTAESAAEDEKDDEDAASSASSSSDNDDDTGSANSGSPLPSPSPQSSPLMSRSPSP